MIKVALVTGSNGLVGTAVVNLLLDRQYKVIGIDNDMRKVFFGDEGSTSHEASENSALEYSQFNKDIRDSKFLESLFIKHQIDAIVHCAAQPSHNFADRIILEDFDINGRATVQLLDLTRKHAPDAVFVYVSTNKVYGTNVNSLKVTESEYRFDFKDAAYQQGIDEHLSIDHTTHSFMGSSKLTGDIYTQEFGNYFGLKTACFRCGCITGANHSGVELHGFMNYIVKCAVEGRPYTIFGYQGKQVRDQIHAIDLARAIVSFIQSPKSGAVYNLGGGRANSASILEIISILKNKGFELNYDVSHDPRIGDHICYYTDNSKFQKDYPEWSIDYDLDAIVEEIIEHYSSK